MEPEVGGTLSGPHNLPLPTPRAMVPSALKNSESMIKIENIH